MPETGAGSAAALRDAKRELLARLLAEEGVAEGVESIARRAESATAPLSHAQEVLWLLDRATPGLIAYNSTLAFRLRGPLDLAKLKAAVDGLVARHDALRTRFVAQGEGALQAIDAPVSADFLVEDIRSLAPEELDAESERRLREHARKAFDLAKDHMFRAVVVRRTENDASLLLLTHHIVSDAWSYGVMMDELSALYAGRALPEPAIQFGDYAAWEREQLTGDALRDKLSYWRENLMPVAPDLAIPTDRPRPTLPTFEGGRAMRIVPRALADQLKALAASEGATLYMVLLAAFQSALYRWSEQDDLVTGSAIAGRNRSETEKIIGYFSAAMPLRTKFVEGEPFRALLGRIRTTVLGALAHQDVPTEALVHELAAQGRPGHAPLFQAVLTMQENQGGRLELPGIEVEPLEIESGTTKFELTLLPSDRAEHLELLLWYRADLFEPATADRFLAHYATLLEAIVRDPNTAVDKLPLLARNERAELTAWNATARNLGAAATMTSLIQAAAAARGDAAAVRSGDTQITWRELSERGHQLAHRLIELGAGPDVPIGLCAERSVDLIVGLYGILASGSAYVPLLPDQPAQRIAQQVAESGARVVVSVAAHRALLADDITVVSLDTDAQVLAAKPAAAPEVSVKPEHIAYVLYTSGSTGTPKGVAVTHANLVHYTRSIASVLGVDLPASDKAWTFATVSTLGADLGHTSVFPALASGGVLHVLPRDVVMDSARFQAYAASHPIDVLKITPSHFQALVGAEMAREHLPSRWLVFGGEACSWELAERARAAGSCRVLNHYGPTETTVGACTFEVREHAERLLSATVPIGKPLPNVTAHVVDRTGELSPVGVPGELYIGGAGVARGYLHRDDLTRERFVTLNGERVYRTGDRVRRLPTGDLEFLGRLDQQVKVRGYRVELGEIETVLGQHPSVRQSVVAMHEGQLVGYVAVNSSTPMDDADIAAHVAASLPDYMVPQLWVRLDAIPLTPNGKVDRKNLPAPVASGTAAASDAPATDAERQMAALWCEVLKKDAVGMHDNFFALGGHSLLAIRLLGKIAKAFGKRLTLRTLFENPTVSALAAVAAGDAA